MTRNVSGAVSITIMAPSEAANCRAGQVRESVARKRYPPRETVCEGRGLDSCKTSARIWFFCWASRISPVTVLRIA